MAQRKVPQWGWAWVVVVLALVPAAAQPPRKRPRIITIPDIKTTPPPARPTPRPSRPAAVRSPAPRPRTFSSGGGGTRTSPATGSREEQAIVDAEKIALPSSASNPRRERPDAPSGPAAIQKIVFRFLGEKDAPVGPELDLRTLKIDRPPGTPEPQPGSPGEITVDYGRLKPEKGYRFQVSLPPDSPWELAEPAEAVVELAGYEGATTTRELSPLARAPVVRAPEKDSRASPPAPDPPLPAMPAESAGTIPGTRALWAARALGRARRKIDGAVKLVYNEDTFEFSLPSDPQELERARTQLEEARLLAEAAGRALADAERDLKRLAERGASTEQLVQRLRPFIADLRARELPSQYRCETLWWKADLENPAGPDRAPAIEAVEIAIRSHGENEGLSELLRGYTAWRDFESKRRTPVIETTYRLPRDVHLRRQK